MSRGGLLDLGLVAVVAMAAWGRTPVGGLVDRAVSAALGRDGDLPALTSFFETGAPPAEVVALVEHAVLPPDPSPDGAFPEPYRTAARMALADDAGALASIDGVYAGDPESALEIYAIGADLHGRAVARARAAGATDPEHLAGHRAFLPEAAARRADRVVSGTMALGTILHLQWPLQGAYRVTSGYGMRFHPVLKIQKFHDGVDLAVPEGTPVYAAQSGQIVAVKTNGVGGNYVSIDHGNGVRTSYCHLSEQDVVVGQMVGAGERIGLSGNTGRSTGPHLHFGVRISGSTVDPLRLRSSVPPA